MTSGPPRARFLDGSVRIEGEAPRGIIPATSPPPSQGGGKGKGGGGGHGRGHGGGHGQGRSVGRTTLDLGTFAEAFAVVSAGSNAGPAPAPPALTYAQQVLADNPLLYFKLDETSGTVATDSSTSANNGTYVNTPTLGQTPLITVGKSAIFTAASSQNITVTSVTYAGATGLTVEAWIKSTFSSTNPEIVCHDTGSDPQRVFQFRETAAGKLEWIYFSGPSVGGTLDSVLAINDGVRHHVVGTWDATSGVAHVYIDGAQNDSAPSSSVGAVAAGGGGFTVASRGGAAFITANLDEVAVYPSALSAARVLAHFNAG